MPGQISQGWPGLIFLSSYAFLPEDQFIPSLGGSYAQILYSRLMLAHETAHQWWGDRVMWAGPRDAWLVEALANHSALTALEEKHPSDMRTALDYYRATLLRPDAKGRTLTAAGPVTLGFRLSSTKFPTGYEEIAYGRGTWLIHMLHEMLRDHAAKDPDARFNAALQELITTLDGKAMSNQQVQAAFEKYLPADLQYENKRSLDWFFDGWVNGSAVPGFALKSVKATVKKGKVTFSGTIVESDAPERLISSLPIYGESRDPDAAAPIYLGRVFIDETETSFTITAPAGTRKLLLDPYYSVLRK
jgi:aminopeptidase N